MPIYDRKGKGKGKSRAPTKARPNACRTFVESDDEGDDVNYSGLEEEGNSDDDMSDFIVGSDEDEEEKDARRALKKRVGKKRAHVILDSDDERDTPEEKEIIFGVRKKVAISKAAIKLMPRFLPSTKMKVCYPTLLSGTMFSIGDDRVVHDGRASQAPEDQPRREGALFTDWSRYLELTSCPDPPRFPMDRVPFLDLRLSYRTQHSSRQVPRRHDPHQTRPGSHCFHGEGEGSCHVNVPQMRRSVLTCFELFMEPELTCFCQVSV